MTIRTLRLISLFILILLLISGCTQYFPENPLKVTKSVPLADNIPYEALGSGKIVFQRSGVDQKHSGIYVIDIGKKTAKGFTLNTGFGMPSISPDGSKIAGSVYTDIHTIFDIYVMDIDGTHCKPVFQSLGQDRYPTWTADSMKLIFWRDGSGDGSVFMQSPVENATDLIVLTKFYYPKFPNWVLCPSGGFSISPQRKLVAVSICDEPHGIVIIDPSIEGKTATSLLLPMNNQEQFESPAFSPDGQIIAFVSVELDSQYNCKALSIKSISPDGENLNQLIKVVSDSTTFGFTPGRVNSVSLCWSPDGTKILFSAPEKNKGIHLFVINANGSGLLQVTNEAEVYDLDVSWSR